LLLLGPRPAAEQQVPPGDAAAAQAAPLTGGLLFRGFNDLEQILPAGAGALEQVESRRHGAVRLVGNVVRSAREGATRAVAAGEGDPPGIAVGDPHGRGREGLRAEVSEAGEGIIFLPWLRLGAGDAELSRRFLGGAHDPDRTGSAVRWARSE